MGRPRPRRRLSGSLRWPDEPAHHVPRRSARTAPGRRCAALVARWSSARAGRLLTGTPPSPDRPSTTVRVAVLPAERARALRSPREDALAALLAARAAAVRDHDRAAFAATLDDPTSGFGLRQLAQYDALAQLPLGTFSYGTPEPAPALSAERVAQLGPDAWVSRVAGRYSLAGFDTAPARVRVLLHRGAARQPAGGWSTTPTAAPRCSCGTCPKFTVVRSATTLVVGSRSGEPAASLPRPRRPRRQAGRGRLDRRPGTAALVLVVPATRRADGRAGRCRTRTQRRPGRGRDRRPVRPPGPGRGRPGGGQPRCLRDARSPAGKQVVVTHEATHVAIRATTNRPVPLWLSEGMADYVGYRDIGATRSRGRRRPARPGPRRQGSRGSLPAAADFDPARTTIAPSYNAAWLAVTRIVDRFGARRPGEVLPRGGRPTRRPTRSDPDATSPRLGRLRTRRPPSPRCWRYRAWQADRSPADLGRATLRARSAAG